MVSVCFYFQVHQPFRLRKYQVFDIGRNHDYFDEAKNRQIAEKVANKCYLPANRIILDLIKNTKGRFRCAYSITGVALEQFERYTPEVIESFKELAKTGCVEFLSETYYHSLSYIYSKEDFRRQVEMHKDKIKKLFSQTPTVFRNTELVFNNELANYVEGMGYKGIIAEGADHILGWRSPNFLYRAVTTKKIKVLLKNYKLSDDIAFRFSNKGWEEWPLTSEKFAQWVNSANGNGEVLNLFMDYETLGEHQWEDTGIFDFLKQLPWEILRHPDNDFVTPTEAIKRYDVRGEVDMHSFVSWADIERDLSAWIGNSMQKNALKELYQLESDVLSTGESKLIEDWRKLQTSDHFYYMCTKWFADGDVHRYFNPYDSPYDSFIAFMNILNDIVFRIRDIEPSACSGPKQKEADYNARKRAGRDYGENTAKDAGKDDDTSKYDGKDDDAGSYDSKTRAKATLSATGQGKGFLISETPSRLLAEKKR
ncbi:glycoside hydrolase family 57 protein [Candidatus Woesearchaeota archaeon]|nr:glycoside hydrolase family 57 protein [Candidatus Woesearchaeota archaeon]